MRGGRGMRIAFGLSIEITGSVRRSMLGGGGGRSKDGKQAPAAASKTNTPYKICISRRSESGDRKREKVHKREGGLGRREA